MKKPQVVRYETVGRKVRRVYLGRAFSRGPGKWSTNDASHFGYRSISQVANGLHVQLLLGSGSGSAFGWEDNGTKFVVSVRDAFAPRRNAILG